MEISMNPKDSTYLQVIESPKYPKKYPNNANCQWIITGKKSKTRITMVFDSFNIEWNTTCSKADYLYVGLIAKYSKVHLCGSRMPASFSLTSKKNQMVLRFISNGRTRKPGFRAVLVAS